MRKEFRYHHIGIPTQIPREGEEYLGKYKMWVCGYERSPYGVEWIRFEQDCPLPELVKTVAHVAFTVDDIEKAIAGKNVIIKPNSPSEGVKIAFIDDNGAPVEFLQFAKKVTPNHWKDMKMQKGMRYHHIGISTKVKREGEVYDKKFKIWMVGCDKSPYSVE